MKIEKKLVSIKFLDHSLCNGNNAYPIPCEVIGYLVKEDKTCYHVASWIAEDEVDSVDTEVFTVVKHKGVVVNELRLVKGGHGKSK